MSLKVPYDQMVIELDKLLLGGTIQNMDQAQDRADTIEAYLEACGWSWETVVEHMANESNTIRNNDN